MSIKFQRYDIMSLWFPQYFVSMKKSAKMYVPLLFFAFIIVSSQEWQELCGEKPQSRECVDIVMSQLDSPLNKHLTATSEFHWEVMTAVQMHKKHLQVHLSFVDLWLQDDRHLEIICVEKKKAVFPNEDEFSIHNEIYFSLVLTGL